MFKLHVKPNTKVEQGSTAYNTMEDFMLSGICSRAGGHKCDRSCRKIYCKI